MPTMVTLRSMRTGRSKSGRCALAALATSIALVGASSCSLVVDTDGLAGVDEREAGPLSEDGGPDARGDGATNESATNQDASADVAADVQGCARYKDAAFCNDFEGVDPLSSAVWTSADVDASVGTLGLTTSFSVSAPHAASFDVPASSPNCSYVLLYRRFNGVFSTLSTHVSLRVENSGYAFSLSTSSTLANTSYQILVLFDVGAAPTIRLQTVISGTPSDTAAIQLQPSTTPIGRWVDLSFEYKPGAHAFLVAVDDASVSLTVPADLRIETPSISVGPFCTGNAIRLQADDIAVFLGP